MEEEEEKEEQKEEEEEEEGESGSTAILHAAAALETPSSDKTGRPVWLPSSAARLKTRTTSAAAAAAARRTPCLNKSRLALRKRGLKREKKFPAGRTLEERPR